MTSQHHHISLSPFPSDINININASQNHHRHSTKKDSADDRCCLTLLARVLLFEIDVVIVTVIDYQ